MSEQDPKKKKKTARDILGLLGAGYVPAGYDGTQPHTELTEPEGEEEETQEPPAAVTEGLHFNTKIKMLEASHHPTKIRLGLRECRRMIENILDDAHPSPNPADDDHRKVLEKCAGRMDEIMESMKTVQVRKRAKK